MLPRRFLARALLVPALAASALAVGAPPAQAVLTGTVSAEDVVLQNTCRQQPVDYAFTISPETLLWQVKLSLVSPSGRSSGGVDLSSVDGDPTSGTISFLICGSASPGTYAVRTTGSYQVVPLVNIPVSVAETTFEVRRATTRTTLDRTHLAGDRYRLVARVEDERRRGFKPTNSAEVLFQRRVDGAWRTIRGSLTLTDRGVARTVVSARPGTRVRAVTKHAGYLGGSTSRSVRLHP